MCTYKTYGISGFYAASQCFLVRSGRLPNAPLMLPMWLAQIVKVVYAYFQARDEARFGQCGQLVFG